MTQAGGAESQSRGPAVLCTQMFLNWGFIKKVWQSLAEWWWLVDHRGGELGLPQESGCEGVALQKHIAYRCQNQASCYFVVLRRGILSGPI